MWVCSGSQSDSNPRCSASRPSSSGAIVSSVRKIDSPNRMRRPTLPAASGAPLAVGTDDPPEAAVEVHVVAEDLAGPLVRVEVERPAGVGDLAPAVAALDRAEQ